jgi:hypothetical protein
MRQSPVPRIALNTKLRVIRPDFFADPMPDNSRRHVIEEFLRIKWRQDIE